MEVTHIDKSILLTIREMVTGDESCDVYDTDLKAYINASLLSLLELGIGPEGGMMIAGDDEVWNDIVINDKMLASVQTFVYLKVKLLFDPPSNSTVLNLYNEQLNELSWRLREYNETFKKEE